MIDYPQLPPRFYGDARMLADAARQADPSLRFAIGLTAVVLAVGTFLFLAKIGAGAVRLVRPLVAVAAAFAMTACSPAALLGARGEGAASVLGNLQQCDRHYEGAIGAGVNGSFRIDCKAQPPSAADAAVKPEAPVT